MFIEKNAPMFITFKLVPFYSPASESSTHLLVSIYFSKKLVKARDLT